MATESGSRPTGAEPDSAVDFGPRPIGDARRSRAVGVAIAAMTLLAVALAKPWAAFEPPAHMVAGDSTAASPAVAATPATRAPTAPDRRLPRPGAVASAIRPHDAWGVRLVADAGPGQTTQRGLVELWLPASPAERSSVPSITDATSVQAVFSIAVDRLRLVGLTAPRGVTVDDLRVIMARPLGRAATLEVREVVAGDRETPTTLLDRAESVGWPPGVYQLRFRLDGQTAAVTFAIFDAPTG